MELDLALWWLWRRLAAESLNGPLAQELLYAAGAAVKKKVYRSSVSRLDVVTKLSLWLQTAERWMK